MWKRGAVAVTALGVLAHVCPSARAGVIEIRETMLVFTAGAYSFDAPNLARNVSMTQDGKSLVIRNPDDFIFTADDQEQARCPDTPFPLEVVTCDLTGITELLVMTGYGNDHVTVDTALLSTLCGGPGDDVITGSRGADLLAGAAGNDVLSGGAGDDFLRADRQFVRLDTEPFCSAPATAPPGHNSLDGGEGRDLVVGDGGADLLRGGAGDDVLFGRPGADELHGDQGDDLVVGQADSDQLDGGAGRDVLSGGPGPDRLDGGADDDDLGVPVLLSVDPDDPIDESIETGDDQLQGGAGNDTLFGGPGDRTVTYGLTSPQKAGGRAETNGADHLAGGDGQDHVSYINREIPTSLTLDNRANDGAPGEGDGVAADVERITGGVSDDALSGDDGAQVLDGGPGSDTLVGLGGADTLDGGAGDAGTDNLAGGAGGDTLGGGPGNDLISGGEDADVLRGGGGDDRLSGDAGDDQLDGEADADTLAGGTGADVIDGGPGVDEADYSDVGAAVTVSLDELRNDGSSGEDWVRLVESARGGTGPDTLVGNAGPNTLGGGAGDDVIDAGLGPDTVLGGAGNDVLRARDGARDALACGAGTDLALVDELDQPPVGPERCERADTGLRARTGEALVRPVRCRVAARLPGMSRTFPLEEPLSIPRSTTLELGGCAARLSTGRNRPSAQAAGGTLLLRRPGSRRVPLGISLAGGSFSACRGAPAARVIRRLSVKARGRVRVQARFAAAIGRDATWTMTDRCRSTVTSVKRATVRVTDAGARRSAGVRKGQSRVSSPKRSH